jgi:NhaP-type Na+/H+ or K+/H+ antiporter
MVDEDTFMYIHLAILAAFAFFYSAIARGVERTWISGPIIFTVFGLLLGPLGLGILALDVTNSGLRLLAELTLALVLFNDAASADLGVLWSNFRIPGRMLSIGLPLTILLGFLVGVLVFDELSLFELAILATILAATDAALGKPVITNKKVPARIREGLNVESGLNDGLCVPILFVFIALAVSTADDGGGLAHALFLVAEEIGIGVAVGLVLAVLAGWVLRRSAEHDWLSETWMQITVIALAIAMFALAQGIGGSGFISAFIGGLMFGKITKQHKKVLLHASEGTGEAFALVTWVVFGSAIIGKVVGYFSWPILLYAVLSLTLIRMLPIVVSLAGTGERVENKLFLGWFGPRGLASIVFTIIVLNVNLAGGKTLGFVVVCTVCLSIIAHGLTAVPLAKAIGRRLGKE